MPKDGGIWTEARLPLLMELETAPHGNGDSTSRAVEVWQSVSFRSLWACSSYGPTSARGRRRSEFTHHACAGNTNDTAAEGLRAVDGRHASRLSTLSGGRSRWRAGGGSAGASTPQGSGRAAAVKNSARGQPRQRPCSRAIFIWIACRVAAPPMKISSGKRAVCRSMSA